MCSIISTYVTFSLYLKDGNIDLSHFLGHERLRQGLTQSTRKRSAPSPSKTFRFANLLTPQPVYLTFFSYALTRPFLFHAILAFSSTHLATTDSSFDAVGRDHARTATTLLLTEVVSAYDETSIGPLLSTIFLLLQREMLSASSHDDVLALLRTAGSLLARPGASDALAKAGTVAARLVVLLAGKDSRASMFRLGGGSLIKALHADPRVSDVLAAAFNQSGAEPREAGVLDLYKANVLLWRVAECDRRKFESAAAEEVELEVLRADLVAAIETFDVDLRLEIGASLTDSQYGRSVVAAVVHTAVLYLERIFVSSPILSSRWRPRLPSLFSPSPLQISAPTPPPGSYTSPSPSPATQLAAISQRPSGLGHSSSPASRRTTRFIATGCSSRWTRELVGESEWRRRET